MTTGRALGLLIAAAMVLGGALFTAQGLGYVDGSAMSGNESWAIVGPILAGLGVGLAIVVLQGRRR